MAENTPAGLEGRYAVITGGTQGLGEATARLFAARGAAGLVICGRNREKGEAVARDIAQRGCEVHFIEADLEKPADAREVIAAADRHFGRLHALVNVAAITDRGTILDTPEDLFDRMFAVNTRAPFFLMQDAAKIMIREGIAGAMVNVLSIAAHGGAPHICAYSASKAALGALTRNAAFTLMRKRIRINGLNIGWMDTPAEHQIQTTYHGLPQDWLASAEAGQPFGRLLKPDEVARAIAFLCSDESGMMTGALVDFGQFVIGCHEETPQPSI